MANDGGCAAERSIDSYAGTRGNEVAMDVAERDHTEPG